MPKLDGVVTGFRYQPDIGFWMRAEPVWSMYAPEGTRETLDVTLDDEGIFVVPAPTERPPLTFALFGRAAFNKPIFYGARGQHQGICTNMVDRIGPSFGGLWESATTGSTVKWVLVGRYEGLEWERSAFVEKPTPAQLESWLGIIDGERVSEPPGVPAGITYELQEVV